MAHKRNRRSTFIAGGAGAAIGAAAFVRTVRAADFQYKLGTALTADNPAIARITQAFNATKAETNGRFQAQVFPAGTIGNEQSLISQVRIGAIQFLVIGTSISTVFPIVNIVGIPFSFASVDQALKACDGDLGALIRKDVESKGLYVFRTIYDFGMRQTTTGLRAIRTPEDLQGLKIRTAATKIFEEFFHTFGAAPTPVATGDTYTALQTHLVDGVEGSLGLIDSFHWAEVQKYLSLTNHAWTNLYLFGNIQAINALPSDIRDVLERNMRKYGLLEWHDSAAVNASLADKLHREGLAVNPVDTEPFRRRLAGAYKSWKNDFGSAWDVLEKYTGKLG